MDREKIEQGVRLLLEGIGEDIHREGLLETPSRVARMFEEIYGGLFMDPAQHLLKAVWRMRRNCSLRCWR